MKILTSLRRSIAKAISPDSILNPFNQAFLWGVGGGYTQYDEKARTYIEQGYNVNPIVYSVINQMATKTSSIPQYIKKVEDEEMLNKANRLRLATKNNMSPMQAVKLMLLEEKAFNPKELPFPMDRPNPTQTWTEFKALYKTFIKTTGNAYMFMLTVDDGPNAGKPIAVYWLPSQDTQIVIKNNADLLSIESPVKCYILTSGRSYIEFKSEDVIHIKYPNPDYDVSGSHLYGVSPLRAGLKNIESSNSGLDLNIKTQKNGGAFGFIHGKNTPITEPQAKALKERLVEMNSSPDDLSKIAGVSAEMGFTRISLTSDELKPFDYLKFDQKQICNVLSWSDKLLNNDDGAKYDNVKQFRKQVVADNIVPDLDLLADALNRDFLPRFKGYDNSKIIFDVTELPEMQADIKEMSEWLQEALDRGVITRNEYRKAINFIKSDESNMDVFTVNTNTISLEESLDSDFEVASS